MCLLIPRVKIMRNTAPEEYLLKEKDYGDTLVYDIFHHDHYLLTLSKEGSLLFMNFDVDETEKEIFKLSHLNQFIMLIQEHS